MQDVGTRAVGRDGVGRGVYGGARDKIARWQAPELGEIRVVHSVERATVEGGDEHAVAVAVESRQVDVFLTSHTWVDMRQHERCRSDVPRKGSVLLERR